MKQNRYKTADFFSFDLVFSKKKLNKEKLKKFLKKGSNKK